MISFKLWSKKEEREMLAKKREKRKEILDAVNKYIAENNIESFEMGNFKYNGKRLSTEEKILVYYNIIASKEENYWKDIITFSWIGQKSELDYLANTDELREKFINNYLGKSFGILTEIENFRKYLGDVEGRGKNITMKDYKNCINCEDLKKSDWTRLNYLLQEVYLKPCHVINMELIYDSLMKGLTIEDIWHYHEIEPYHIFKFRNFNTDYIKEKVA